MSSGVVVVVPTCREAANLTTLLDGIAAHMPGARVLVVDDVSGDGTPELLRAHPHYERHVFLLERTDRRGFSSALRDGYRWALDHQARVVLQMDADLSHDPADLPRLVEAVDQGAGLAIGSRYCPGGGIQDWAEWRRFLSRSAGRYVRFWTGMPVRDPTAGLRAFRSEVLSATLLFPSQCDGYAFQVEMAHAVWKLGNSICEVPVVFTERREGKSKLTMAMVWESIFRIPFLRWRHG